MDDDRPCFTEPETNLYSSSQSKLREPVKKLHLLEMNKHITSKVQCPIEAMSFGHIN